MRVLAVGDIHCKSDIIKKVSEIVDDYDVVVFIGDYVDDWDASSSDSISAWRMMKELQESNPKVIALTGNHDYSYVNKLYPLSSGYKPFTQSMINFPENSDLKKWVSNLPVIHEIDGVVYSHAGVTLAWNNLYNGEQTTESLWNDLSPLWVRPQDGYEYQSYQVFGHTPSDTCWEVADNVWCIDTFSTERNGKPIGDGTVLEIIDGKTFKKIKIHENNNYTSSVEGVLPRQNT